MMYSVALRNRYSLRVSTRARIRSRSHIQKVILRCSAWKWDTVHWLSEVEPRSLWKALLLITFRNGHRKPLSKATRSHSVRGGAGIHLGCSTTSRMRGTCGSELSDQ